VATQEALSRSLAVVIIIIIIAVSGGFAVYSAVSRTSINATTNSSLNATTVSEQLIVSLAQSHWAAIDEKNLTLIMSQYSSRYEAVWFFINNSAIGPTNGRYDCNIPTGPNNCSYFPMSAWQKLFNDTGAWSYSVCNITVVPELDGRESVHALVMYTLDQNSTLRVPYEMDFQYYNGTWAVWKEWFGLQQDPATVLSGVMTATSCSEFSSSTI
jgi:hypothetical protein